MLISHFKIHFWLSWLFPVVVAGAFSPHYDVATVLLVTVVASILNFFALLLSWSNRSHIEKIKPLSDNTAIAGMVLFLIMLSISGLLQALLWLLVCVQLALNLTFKEERQFYYNLLISFILLFAGASDSKTGLHLVYIIIYCVLASLCLGYFFMDKRLQKNQGTMQKMDWPVGSRIKVIFALISISFIIYLLIPRFSAGNFGSQFGESDQYYSDKKWEEQVNKDTNDSEPDTENNQKNPSNTKPSHNEEASGKFQYNGFSDKFDIRGEDTGTGLPPNVIVAYLQAQHDTYLKVETFDKFNGISWEKSIRSDVKKKLKFGKITLLENEKTNFRQNITIAENLGPYIPAASIPVQLHFPATVISIDSYQMLKIPSGLSKGTHYTIDSNVKFINGRLFSGTHYKPRKNDLQLPENIDERIRNLSQSITKNASSELEKAKLLEEHLRENYQYSFESIFNSQNKTPVAKFLFDDKKGHCEYFASSLAIMLRTLGIHSRLITGFSATTRNPLTGFHEIRVLDGHAWVEAWVDNKGWAVLEPTPIYTRPMQYEDRLSAKEIQDYAEKLGEMYQQSDISHGISLEFIVTSAWLNISTLFIDALSYIKLFFRNSWQLLAGLAGIFIIAMILWEKWKLTILARLSYFKVISYKPRGQKADIYFYMKHIQKVMNAKGVSRLPGTTIEQYVKILDVLPDVDIDKRQLTDLINSSYYATAPAHDLDPELLRQFFLKL